MKTILVPVDFSENSRVALDYAIMIAQKTNSSLILIHTLHIAVPDPFFPWSALSSTEAAERAMEEMQKYVNDIIEYKHVRCSCILEYGDPVEVIAELTKTKKIDLVIMGVRGAAKKNFMGSKTKGIIKKASCPVIAVPENIISGAIRKITYATDYRHSDKDALEYLSGLLETFNAELHIIHIATGNYTDATEKLLMKNFAGDASEVIEQDHISQEIINDKNIETVLRNLVQSNSTDMLVMSMQKRNIIEQWWDASLTQKLIMHLRVPLMVFHYKKESIYFLS
jgi:nucleotide-binding universal stress UspA family protein